MTYCNFFIVCSFINKRHIENITHKSFTLHVDTKHDAVLWWYLVDENMEVYNMKWCNSPMRSMIAIMTTTPTTELIVIRIILFSDIFFNLSASEINKKKNPGFGIGIDHRFQFLNWVDRMSVWPVHYSKCHSTEAEQNTHPLNLWLDFVIWDSVLHKYVYCIKERKMMRGRGVMNPGDSTWGLAPNLNI